MICNDLKTIKIKSKGRKNKDRREEKIKKKEGEIEGIKVEAKRKKMIEKVRVPAKMRLQNKSLMMQKIKFFVTQQVVTERGRAHA